MIPCCRNLFDVPDDVAYLNCAYTGPLLKSAVAAGIEAVQQKASPWGIKPQHFFTTVEENRERFAGIIGTTADCVAIVPAASYGIAIAAKNIPVRHGQKVVVLEEQFPSNLDSWVRATRENGAELVVVERPTDYDWTAAVLAAVDERTAITALPNCHWTDGTIIDLVAIGEKCRKVGAALVIDGTQSIGALPFSVDEVRPDVLVTAAHKWLLGPYSYGFCYVAPHWHDGAPLEENWMNRAGAEDFAGLTNRREGYRPGARRYDAGEASNFILAPIAQAALEQIREWTVDSIAQSLRATTDRIAERAAGMGFAVAPRELRAPHLIGLRAPFGLPDDVPSKLAVRGVYVSVRGSAIRVAPHLHNNDADLDRFFLALEELLPKQR